MNIQIENQLSKMSKRHFLKADYSKDLPDHLRVLQLRHLTRLPKGETLPKFYNPELPLDEVLLKISECYFSTRKLAHVLGIELEPKLISNLRNFETFDPGANKVTFSPVGTDIHYQFRAEKNLSKLHQNFFHIRRFVIASYHDLNHAIFFNTLQPKAVRRASNWKQISNYFNFVEALTILRDLQLADELGPTGHPLHWLGVILRHNSDDRTRLKKLTQIQFTQLLSFIFLEQQGMAKGKIFQKFEKLELTPPVHPLQSTDPEFMATTSSQWLLDYRSRVGNILRLPIFCSKFGFRLKSIDEDYLLHVAQDPAFFKWFSCLFPQKNLRS